MEERVRVYINHKGRRKLVKALVIKENVRTVLVRLKDGRIIKRNKERDVRGGDNA